jgi:hypothetical protein
MCCSLWLHVLEYFQQSYNSHLWSRDWVMCCSLWLHVLEYFQQSYPIPTYKAGIEWCAALLWLHVLKYFSTVLPNSTYKAGIEWCAALCDSCVRVFFNSQFPPIKQGWVMCCSFVIPCVVIFQQSYPISTYEAGLSDVLLFCDYMC